VRSAILIGADSDDESLGVVNPEAIDHDWRRPLGLLHAVQR
jgi:hypothetical protein